MGLEFVKLKLNIVAIAVFITCTTLCSSRAQGENVAIVHKPSYINIVNQGGSIPLTDLQHILLSIHGFTLHKELQFQGLYALSPFQHPKSSVVVSLYGGDKFVNQLNYMKIVSCFIQDDVHVPTHALRHHLHHLYGEESNSIEINHDSKVNDFSGTLEGMSDSLKTVLSSVSEIHKLQVLNASDPTIFHLLRQASLILQSLDKMAEGGTGVVDFYSFEIYLPTSDSAAVNTEAAQLLNSLFEWMESKLRGMYGEDFVVLAVSLPEDSVAKSRKTRSLMAITGATLTADLATANLAVAYTADYPVIFHLCLWLVVFLFLLTLFTIYGMMSMDPGNDSIIYRMTATKIKKDN
ncbi:ATP6AP2 [Bugula neritina]|uniref:ATP6AP2 n=1 Tax=Bugula neritina TaxID=10212 RepID=A0A7J7JYB3_BUGNE|nr:ATP6AP2 [Bugula neritina]